ncbi:hypothetical protein [Paramagnetospirillum magneticum]|uniref:Uncharacterized protein n=1 Tax=Paramagnetospirillum magneticum (strain ATCC 700264 / AMB-1) TaxID=342108 RepID=Q2W6D0_PARM1|nr:hypothetical protein [Paramagnetospirillum magneticum]BAE50595.1 hypothetical protein amb1791 [Paramagnetospirillum magneticum AMB-1]
MAKKGKSSGNGLMTALARPLAAIGRLMGGGKPVEEEEIVLPAEVSSSSLVDDSFTMALESLLAEDDGHFQTKLHLISLVEFHEAVGDKWARIAEKVMLIAEGVINLHLGAGNVYGRKGSDLFVLLFRNTPAPEARRRAVRIAQELGTRLVGSQFTGHDRPLALAAEISLADAVAGDGQLDLEALAAAVTETRAVIAEQASPRAPIAPPDDAAPRRDKEPQWAAMNAAERAKVDPNWKAAVVDGAARTKADPNWQPVATERPPAEIDPGLEATPPMPGDAALSMVWRPTWMDEGEVIGAYRAQVLRVDQPGQPAYEGSRAYPGPGDESIPLIDRFTAGAAVRGIKAAMADGSPARIIVPLHWGSLGTTARMSVLAPFADIPEAVRARGLIIDVFGVPATLSPVPLAEAIAALGPLCREVMVRVPLSNPALARAASAGARSVSIDLAELPNADKTDDDHLLAALLRVRSEALGAGLGVSVWGVRRRKVVVGTVLGGFAMMNGPGLMKDLPKPAKVLPAPRSRFAPAPS